MCMFHVYVYLRARVCMSCVCIYIYVCMYVYICMYVCMYERHTLYLGDRIRAGR